MAQSAAQAMHCKIPSLRMCLNRHIPERYAASASRFRAILMIALGGARSMDDAMDWNPEDGIERPQLMVYDPPNWVTTDLLETELWNAIMEDFSADRDEESDDFEEIDDFFDDEEDEDEDEQRRSTLKLLATLRPQLAELLGGPPAE